jgi:hypothetical protein
MTCPSKQVARASVSGRFPIVIIIMIIIIIIISSCLLAGRRWEVSPWNPPRAGGQSATKHLTGSAARNQEPQRESNGTSRLRRLRKPHSHGALVPNLQSCEPSIPQLFLFSHRLDRVGHIAMTHPAPSLTPIFLVLLSPSLTPRRLVPLACPP